MRLIVLAFCGGIAVLVFATMLLAVARHREQSPSRGDAQTRSRAEYVWALIPWLILTLSALPAVRLILAEP